MPRLPRMPALLPLLCAPLWMGCASAPPPAVVVPPSLLACRPEPPVPAAPDDQALARWILDLAEAGEDCRSRLSAVREIVAP